MVDFVRGGATEGVRGIAFLGSLVSSLSVIASTLTREIGPS